MLGISRESTPYALWPLVLATRAGVIQAVLALSNWIPVIKEEIIALEHIKGHVNLSQVQIVKLGYAI